MSLFGRAFKKDEQAVPKKGSQPSKVQIASSYDDEMDLTTAKAAVRDKCTHVFAAPFFLKIDGAVVHSATAKTPHPFAAMNDWSQIEVIAWLETIDLHEHKASFFENKISGACLFVIALETFARTLTESTQMMFPLVERTFATFFRAEAISELV